MNIALEKLQRQLAANIERTAELKSKQMLREMREEKREQNRLRRQRERCQHDLGGAALTAGLESWHRDEVLGLLLHALDDLGDSPAFRLGLRKRAEHYQAPRGAVDPNIGDG